MKVYEDINYSVSKDPRLLLDIYAAEENCRATLLWMHGGGLETGSRKDVRTMASQLAEQGITVLSIDYRLYPQAKWPEFIEDAAAAVTWVMRHTGEYGFSANLFVGGSSAGAYLTMMLCFDREYLHRHDICPEQISGFIFDAGQPTTHLNVLKYRGEDARRCVIDSAAALYHIRDSRPNRPLLLLFSDDDIPCRLEQNHLFKATLISFGYEEKLIEMIEIKGYPHCGYNDAVDEDGNNLMAVILERFIRFPTSAKP